MSDAYQAIYDAVCQRMGHPDIGGAIERVARESFDVSWIKGQAQDAISTLSYELARPFVLLRPKMYPDGNQWCALYGDNIQEGVVGFGDSPELASYEFDKAWRESLLDATAKARGEVQK